MARQGNDSISRQAQHNPIGINKPVVDTQETPVTEGEDRVMRSTGDASDALDMIGTHQAIDDRPVTDEKLAMLAFMDESVEVQISTTTDKNAEQVFELCVNGRIELFRRGQRKTVKRYFVDRLARMKQTIYTQREVTNAQGVKDIVNEPHTALKYDFAVTRDDNRLGQSWLRAVIAEPG